MTLRASFQDSSSQAWDVTACNMHLSALFIVGNTLLYCAEADVYKFCMTSHFLHNKTVRIEMALYVAYMIRQLPVPAKIHTLKIQTYHQASSGRKPGKDTANMR